MMEVYFLLIDHNKKPLGDIDGAQVPHDASVITLKDKIKERRPDIDHRTGRTVAAAELDVWRCKDRDMGKGSDEDLEENIKGFEFSKTGGHVEKVDPRIKVAGLNLAPIEVLVVQTPGAPQAGG
jgi:hypothetical protein